MSTHSIRITYAAQGWLGGTHLFQLPDDLSGHGYGEAGRQLVRAWEATEPRKDKSTLVPNLSADSIRVLHDYADAGVYANGDECGVDMYAMAERNACLALRRQCLKALVEMGEPLS